MEERCALIEKTMKAVKGTIEQVHKETVHEF
jgi:hypothetical protein